MYSLVLMATLASPTTAIDCHKRCYGCTGCSGSYASCSCYGSCSGCWGSRCSGSRCSGCYGSCYGRSSCSGCYGSCSGCSGCYGSAYYYSGSCWGGHSCHGCTGSTCAGTHTHSSNYVPSYEYQQPAAPAEKNAAPAKVSITLPADAKLYVDGQLTKTMDKSFRTFMTPDLDNGQEYRYVMKAEVLRDGLVQSETKTVIVKAGMDISEAFETLSADTKTASNR
jgi:uncharacterized protein (TIGR03000 family)